MEQEMNGVKVNSTQQRCSQKTQGNTIRLVMIFSSCSFPLWLNVKN